ncbi:MAG TPA: hypothetical protein VFA74_06435 [Terriglobales bacterium]|nr:hypothetical protein [Terriglobales bacterium]
MRIKLISTCSTLAVLIGLSLYSMNGPAQNAEMARHEPHMSAALGHLREARAELDKATPNKGGHREKAMELVDQAIQQVQQGEVYDERH